MKKTLLTLAVLLAGVLGAQAQTNKTLKLYDTHDDLVDVINEAAAVCEKDPKATYKITFNSRAINQDNWNVMILPFDVKPGVFSKALGYATCDVLVKDNPNPYSMHFAINTSDVIPAGTPFLFKPGTDKASFQEVTYFKEVVIKKVESQMVQTDKNGNRFIGVFSPTTIYGKGFWYMSQGMWKQASKFTEENPVNLKPFRAYLDLNRSKSAEAPMIIIDEPDGTTTVIDAATFNKGEFKSNGGLDTGWYTVTGLRLSDEPTAKGVYIHNARKVVIK